MSSSIFHNRNQKLHIRLLNNDCYVCGVYLGDNSKFKKISDWKPIYSINNSMKDLLTSWIRKIRDEA